MEDIKAGHNLNMFLIGGLTILLCFILHLVYKAIFSTPKRDASLTTESDSGRFHF